MIKQEQAKRTLKNLFFVFLLYLFLAFEVFGIISPTKTHALTESSRYGSIRYADKASTREKETSERNVRQVYPAQDNTQSSPRPRSIRYAEAKPYDYHHRSGWAKEPTYKYQDYHYQKYEYGDLLKNDSKNNLNRKEAKDLENLCWDKHQQVRIPCK